MKKRKMSQAWKNRIWNGSILAAFVAAMAVFVFLLQTEKRVLAEYEKEFSSSFEEDFPAALTKTRKYLDLSKDGSRVKIKDEYLYVQNRILMPFMEEPRQRD